MYLFYPQLIEGINDLTQDRLLTIIVLLAGAGVTAITMASQVPPNDVVLPRQHRNPVIPESTVSSESMLDEDVFARFPWIHKGIEDIVGLLAVGMDNVSSSGKDSFQGHNESEQTIALFLPGSQLRHFIDAVAVPRTCTCPTRNVVVKLELRLVAQLARTEILSRQWYLFLVQAYT
jgi:hypothetical protein